MTSRRRAVGAVALAVAVTLPASLLFALAAADFAGGYCTHIEGAGWPGNNNCADAWRTMWRAGPLALAGLAGLVLAARVARHA